MKEMTYNKGWIDPETPFTEILDEGTYKGVRYVCMNRGSHPCSYVICDQDFLNKHITEWGDLDCISVHGGVTWTGKMNEMAGFGDYPDETVCFGWDYGHAGDWAGYMSEERNQMCKNRKYRTQDLIYDCHRAIDQYLKALKA